MGLRVGLDAAEKRFLLSPYRLIGTCNSVQNCTFRWPTEGTEVVWYVRFESPGCDGISADKTNTDA
jgi:hypothetical protein